MAMRFISLPLLFAVVLVFMAALPTWTQAETCYDTLDPLKRRVKVATECSIVSNDMLERRQQGDLIDQANSTDMFEVKFTCGISNKVLCDKVKNAFNVAGKIITSTLNLNTPITVNATFTNFCDSFGDCGSPEGFLTLGGAAPARTIPMTDDDDVMRLYPQALVKQFQFSKRPQFTSYDIVAMFNSVADFWFEGDGPIGRTQSDFLFVIVHELVHGLGFTSSWDDYINQVPEALTPDVSAVSTGNGMRFRFIEYAFDRYMVMMPKGTPLTKMAQQINSFTTSDAGSTSDVNEFVTNFMSSSQYDTARQVFAYGTTANALAFQPTNSSLSNAVTLETSLNPYQTGSSISHVDYNKYTGTSDFLMRYLQDRGVSLGDAILQGGNFSGGPLGPGLRLVLQTLGYATSDNPSPYRPRSSGSDYLEGAASSILPSINLVLASSLTLALLFMGRSWDAICIQ